MASSVRVPIKEVAAVSSGHDDKTEETNDSAAPIDAQPEVASVTEAKPQLPDDELSGQADLDERLARPVLEGTSGIESAQVWISAFLVLVVALIAYSNSFSLPIHYADREAVFMNPGAQSVAMAPIGARATGIPLLPMLTIALSWWFAPGSLGFFHAINVALHALNGVLVYLLARRLLRIGKTPDPEEGGFQLSEPIAMLGGLIVAVHPLATESVNLVIGRGAILCATFTLSAVILVLRAADKEDGIGVGSLIGAGICFGLAWACDVAALFVPAFMLIADWIANGSAVRKHLAIHAAFWGIAIALGAWWMTVSNLDKSPYAVLDPAVIVAPPVKATAFSRGMLLVATPVGLNIDHDLPPAGGFLNPDEPGSNPFLTATTGIGLGLIALILIAARSPAGLALAWFLLALLPAAYFVPPNLRFNERALYLAIVSAGLAMPWIVSKVVSKKSTAVAGGIAAVVLLLAAAAGTFTRNTTWQDEYALWEDAQQKSPGAPDPIVRLGTLHFDLAQNMLGEAEQLARNNDRPAAIKRRDEALAEFGAAMNSLQQAVGLKPDDANLRAELGITFAYLNRRDDAIKTLTEAIRLNPALQEPTLRLATLYAANPNDPMGGEDRQKALDYFARAARLGRLTPDAAANYAAILARNGNVLAAGQVLAPYVTAEDTQTPANAVFQQLRPLIEAARDAAQKAQKAEKENPSSPEAVKSRIHAMLASGEMLQAFYHLERYLQLHADDAEGWLLMGTTCARAGQHETFVKEYAATAPAAIEGAQPIWTQLVRQCAEQGSWAAARAYIEYAATQSDAYAKPLYRLGELAKELKQPAIAATVLDEYVKTNADDPAPWLLLCDIAIEANNMAQARRCLDEAERLGADPAAVAPRREKAGVTPESEKQKPRSVLQ